MKAFLSLLACISCLSSFSQNIERSEALHHFFGWYESSADLLEVSSGGDVIVAGTRNGPTWEPGFYVLNSQGDFIKKSEDVFAGIEVGTFIQVLETPSGNFVFTLYGGLCDVCCFGVAFVYDPAWNVIWQGGFLAGEPYSVFDYEEGTATGKVVALSNDHLVFVDSTSGLTARDLTGAVIWTKTYPYIFLDVARHLGDTIVAATTSGLALLDAQGNQLALFPDYDFEAIKVNGAGRLTGKNGPLFTLLDPQFNLISTAVIPNSGSFDFDNEHFAVLKNTSNSFIVSVFDTSLGFLEQFEIPAEGKYVRALALQQGAVLVVGDEAYFGGISAFVKSYTLDGISENHGTDAGISAVDIPSFLGYTDVMSSPWGWSATLHCDQVKVTLKNYGTNKLDSVWIMARFPEVQSFCTFPQVQRVFFDNLNLLPGDSVVLDLGDFNAYFYPLPPLPLPTILNVCYWTYTPNARLDLDHSNDAFCQTIAVTVPANERQRQALELTLSPNPAGDFLLVNIEKALPYSPRLAVLNYLGQIVQVEELAAGSVSKELNVSGLASGMYWLKIEAEGGGEARLFVKKKIVSSKLIGKSKKAKVRCTFAF